MQQIICLWKQDVIVHFRILKVHLNGVTATFRPNNEVQIKTDLKFIYMHKEISMQQVLTSKWGTLLHKNILLLFDMQLLNNTDHRNLMKST